MPSGIDAMVRVSPGTPIGRSGERQELTIRAPHRLTVVVARPPRFGGKVASFDATEALKIKGVVDVKQIGSGVAVYGQGMWPAIKGREALKVVWDESGAETRGSAELIAEYRALARTPGTVAGNHGDAQAVLARFISDGHLLRHPRQMRELYQVRQQVLIHALASASDGALLLTSSDRGMHLLLESATGSDDETLSRKALTAGVMLAPLSHYAMQSQRRGWLFGYAGYSEAEIVGAARV
eukprot:gene18571-37554_t